MSHTFDIAEIITTEAEQIASISVAPDISDRGTIAFVADNSDSATEIFKIGSNGTLESVVEEGELGNEFSSLDRNLSINNNDAVLYSVSTREPSSTQKTIELILDENGTTTTIEQRTETTTRLESYTEIYLNDNDFSVVRIRTSSPFLSTEDIFLLNSDGESENIATALFSADNDVENNFFSVDDLAFNNQNVVAYSTEDILRDPNFRLKQSVFTTDGVAITVAESSGPRAEASVTDLAINDSGLLIYNTRSFSNDTTVTSDEIFRVEGAQTSSLADTSGLFDRFEEIVLNNEAEIVFSGFLDDGTEGIFAGFDPESDRIIAVGDALSGSTVVDLEFSAEGLNNEGIAAFKAELADGTEGIYRVDIRQEDKPEINTISGTKGKDNLVGTDGRDIINGRGGIDSLFGLAGNDTLFGGGRNDTLDGGSGNDNLFGGVGRDLFVLRIGDGEDLVSDYKDNRDRFILADGLQFAELSLVQSGDNVQIQLAATNEIIATVASVSVEVLDSNDFIVEN